MIKKFFSNAWVKNVGGGALAVLLLRLVDWVFINDFFWDKIKNFFGFTLEFINTTYSVKLYWLILFPAAILLILYGYKRLKTKNNFPKTVNIDIDPDWISYTKDVFENIQYRWGYEFDHSKKNYVIINVRAYCNQCNCQIVGNTCPNCKSYYSDSSYMGGSLKPAHEVEALVIHRIENKLYKNRPTTN